MEELLVDCLGEVA